MAWVIGKDLPEGRLYLECRTGAGSQWTNDVNEARTFKEKHGADDHMRRFDLLGCASIKVKITDPTLSEDEKKKWHKFTERPGFHTFYTDNVSQLVIWVEFTHKASETGNAALNAEAVEEAKKICDQRGLELRILLCSDWSRKRWREISLDDLSYVSLKQGQHGAYWQLRLSIEP